MTPNYRVIVAMHDMKADRVFPLMQIDMDSEVSAGMAIITLTNLAHQQGYIFRSANWRIDRPEYRIWLPAVRG